VTPYADASWYVIELGSDVECGICGNRWNPKESQVDRFVPEFLLGKNGRVTDVKKKEEIHGRS